MIRSRHVSRQRFRARVSGLSGRSVKARSAEIDRRYAGETLCPRHPKWPPVFLIRLAEKSMLASFAADCRFALRVLRKNPLVTLVAVLCIALGSGAVASIYSVMNALVLQPLSGAADATRLVRIERKAPNENDGISASYPLYEYFASRARSLGGLAAWNKGTFTIGRRGSAGTTVYGNFVTTNFFTVLGVRPLLGRFPATE